MERRLADYSRAELSTLTNSQIKDIYQRELEIYPGEERFLRVIRNIDNGTWRNPYKNKLTPRSLAWKIPLFVWLLNTGIGNITPGPYRIPLLSDVTPVVVYMQYLNGENRLEIMTQTNAYDRSRLGKSFMDAMGVKDIDEGRQQIEETQRNLEQFNQNVQKYQEEYAQQQEQLNRQWQKYNQTMEEVKTLLPKQN